MEIQLCVFFKEHTCTEIYVSHVICSQTYLCGPTIKEREEEVLTLQEL